MSEPSANEHLPAFFAQAPVICVRDPLAEFLGAATDGVLCYRYVDAVRLAGHSCPTVAGAFLMTRAELRALYADVLPARGGVRVEVRDDARAGVTGVIANVVALLTGATVDTGFKGLAGRFDRRHLLAFEAPIAGQLRFTRNDDGRAVEVSAHAHRVPGDPRTQPLMAACLHGHADATETALFRELWQERVRRMLLQHADDPEIIEIH